MREQLQHFHQHPGEKPTKPSTTSWRGTSSVTQRSRLCFLLRTKKAKQRHFSAFSRRRMMNRSANLALKLDHASEYGSRKKRPPHEKRKTSLGMTKKKMAETTKRKRNDRTAAEMRRKQKQAKGQRSTFRTCGTKRRTTSSQSRCSTSRSWRKRALQT